MLNIKTDEKIDAHAECITWAASGECKKNAEWMNLNCQKSCSDDPSQLEATTEPEVTEIAPTRGRRIVDEGHETQENSIVRGRLKSTKHDESLLQSSAQGLTKDPETIMDMMGDFQARMETYHSSAPKRAEAFTVKKSGVAQGRFKSRYDVQTSTQEKVDQHIKTKQDKQDAMSLTRNSFR